MRATDSAFNLLDLFSGIGGFARGAALARLRFRHHLFSEINEHASQVYAKNFPQAEALGDIGTIDVAKIKRSRPGPWIVTGGFPCQDISTAGRGDGITGGRSSLWWQMHRVIGELRPAYAIIENVPALCSRGFERVLFSLADLGYDAEWEVVSAASVGAPHVRKRVWIVAYPDVLRELGPLQLHARGGNMADHHQPDRPHDRNLPWSAWPTVAAQGTIFGQPCVARMDDGISPWVDRIKACGNAIVPQVVEGIFRRLACRQPPTFSKIARD